MRIPGAAVLYRYKFLQSSSSSSSSWTILLVLFALVLLSASTIQPSDSDSGPTTEVQWQILTKLNFSSQIRLHPDILLIVTVPWCGESRSLMKELAHLISKKHEMFFSPKLMLVYRNSERMLADALGATEGTTVLYFHHSLPYRYQGRLRAQNILSSVHYFLSLLPEEIPLKSLNSPGDLKAFLESSDKTLLLLEFCGWTPRLLAKGKNNASESIFGFSGEINETLASEGKKYQKGMESEKISCGIDDGFGISPSLGEFTHINSSDPLDPENIRSDGGVSCNFEEYQRFEAMFSEFLTVVREFFLPPERLRFALVPERSMLSSLDVGDSGSPWSMMLYFAGCPNCLKVLKETDDLKSVLKMHASPVIELQGNEHDIEAALPENEPSVLLFIDRSSDSSEIRRKSKELLDAFRELALHNQITSEMNAQSTANPHKFPVEAYKASRKSGHPTLNPSPVSQKITKLKDTMSIMIVNDGKHVSLDKVASDLQGRSLNEIFEYVHQKKEMKLSSLAKDAGFQLLSDDFDIKITETVPLQAESKVTAELPLKDLEGSADVKKDQIPNLVDDREGEELVEPTETEPSPNKDEKTYFEQKALANIAEGTAETKTLSIENREEQLNFTGFRGSFFFSDGNFRLLKALTSVEKIPCLVIVDPALQQHYLLPEEAEFSYSVLSDFLDSFVNGTLHPYQRSEFTIPTSREAPSPPFVNLDFHTVDSFPCVTARTFLELVVGNQSDSTNDCNAWKKDVLVLFSVSWCGFCQRMELVVREVYRAFKGYANSLTRNEKFLLSSDDVANDVKNAMVKLPLIYLMDCTLNDCCLILNSRIQRELYPSLLLFPAERKNAVSYGGDMAVSEVIKFIADHGTNSHWIFSENGILWIGADQGMRNPNLNKDESQRAIPDDAPPPKDKYHKVLLKDRTPKPEIRNNQIRPHKPKGSQEISPEVVVGTVIVATNKLLYANPFDKSEILILKANKSTGFHGLIINKPISWDTLQELEEGLEILKEAPLYFGGPVIIREMPLVSLTRKSMEDEGLEILPGIYFLDQWTTMNLLQGLKKGNQTVSDYWFFLGYSSWGWDQLFDEIAEGAWEISNGDVGELHWPGR